MMESSSLLSWNEFIKVDMRVGTIVDASIFEEVRKPAYKLLIDFGDLGIRKSSAQITDHYQPEELIGKQVVAVVNFPVKQIANMMSECLILGAIQSDHSVVILQPQRKIKNGLRIG